MKSVEKSAKTREEALEAALQELEASISDVDVQVLDEGSKGLFGLFGSRLARVRVTLKEDHAGESDELDVMSLLRDEKPAPKKPAAPKSTEPKAPREPREPRESREPKEPKEPRAPKEPKEPRPPKPADQPRAEAPRRPEPVRRVNPDRKPDEARPADRPARESAQEAAERVEADMDAAMEAPRKPRRNRKPKAKKPAASVEGGENTEQKPLPPKQINIKPIEKPVVTMIPDAELDSESPAGRAKAFLQELTHLMGVDVEIAMGTDQEGNVFGSMTGDTLGILIGRRGETLDAIQYLTSLKVNRSQDNYTRVTLDTENYRAKREDTLIRLANRMANRAVKTGRRVALEPMNPYERRIIHSALQANEAVDTHSEGDEPNRHVVITVRRA